MPFLDVVLHLHPGAAEHAQAVEVTDQRPVGVSSRVGSWMSLAHCSRAAYTRTISVVWLLPGAMKPR